MQIKIGELFLGGNSKFQISPGIQGLDSPAIRVGDGLYAGRDGGFVSGHFYGHRNITIKGFFVGDTCEEATQLRKILSGYLRIRYSLPIIIDTADGEYYTEGFITGIKSTIDNLVSGEFQLTLLCPNPILYESENEEPVVISDNLVAGDTVNIPNDGDVEIPPVITIKGIFENVEIINTTTEKTMQLSITTENASDEVVIDMEKRLITLNGSAINEYRTPLSSWWVLAQENNDVSLNFDTNQNTTTTIKYKRGFVGV